MEPLTPLDTLCRIIIRAREYEAQVPGSFSEDEDTSVEEELQTALEDLGEDQLAEVIAFCWVGQGTYDASDWDEAVAEANDYGGSAAIIEELLEMPMFPSVLESGMAAFDLNCDGIGDVA